MLILFLLNTLDFHKMDLFQHVRGLSKHKKYTIALFYFALGFIFVFPSMNIWLFLKEKTGLDPGRLAMEMQIVDFPWLFKPFYAWMSDRYPIAGYRRKSYVILFSLWCSIMWMIMPIVSDNLLLFYVIWTLENLFLCVADVVVDAIIVERVQHLEKDEESRGKLQTICSTCRSLGKCVGAILGAFTIAQNASRKEVFYITAIAPLVVSICSFYIQEKVYIPDEDKIRTEDSSEFERGLKGEGRTWRYYVMNMINGFTQTDMWKFCLVSTCYHITPDPDAGYFFYYEDVMKVPDFALQMVMFSGELGLLFGNLIYGIYLRKLPARFLMIIATLMVVCTAMGHAVVIFVLPFSVEVKFIFVYLAEFIEAMSNVFLFMPMVVMASQLCTEGVEGTTYALVLSIQNLGSFLDNAIASQIMNILGISGGKLNRLWYMSFGCAFWFLFPLPLLRILPEKANLTRQLKHN